MTPRQIDVELLEKIIRRTPESDGFTLQEKTAELESALEDIVGWTAVGVGSVFSAALMLAMTVDNATCPIRGTSLPAQAEAARRAATRSNWESFGKLPFATSGPGWELCDWPNLSFHDPRRQQDRSVAVIVRELSSAAALTTLGVEAVIWDASGSNLVTVPGELAVVFTRDTLLTGSLRALRHDGQLVDQRFLHEQVGLNSLVDDVVAEYVLSDLASLPKRRVRCREYGKFLCSAWSDAGARHLVDLDGGGGIHLTKMPGAAVTALDKQGLRARTVRDGWVIPVPLHLKYDELVQFADSIVNSDDTF